MRIRAKVFRDPVQVLVGIAILFLGTSAPAFQFTNSPLAYPHELATDGTNLWVSDFDARRIHKLDGEFRTIGSFAFTNGSPRGLAWSNGVLFLATGTRIYRINAETGANIADYASPDTSSPNQQGLALGDGKLWIASLGSSDDRIYGVNPTTGAKLLDFAAPGTNPRGLTFYNGSLWNLDSSDNKLYRLSPTNGAVQASFPIPLEDPRGLTFFNEAFLMADNQVDMLMRFDITNTFSTAYIPPDRFYDPGQSLWLPFISSHPLDQTNAAIRRILFFQHGVNDNAVAYFGYAHYAARQAGRLDETLIISPQLLGDDKLQSAPPTNMIYWTGGRFWGGLSASASAPYPRSERLSSFALLDSLLSQLTTNTALFPQLEEIVISGHSGGGQFVNRYAATSPFERTMLPPGRGIIMRYVVMNPSSYMYFDRKRYDPTTLNLNAGIINFVEPSAPSADYNEYGYGLEALYEYPSQVGSNNMVAQYPNRKVIYMAGADDTSNADLDTSAAGMLEGANRYERSLIYYAHLKDHFNAMNLPGHRFAIIPGVGHDGFGMITSADGLRYHFQGRLRINQVTWTGATVAISWTGGDGFASVETSTNLRNWANIADKTAASFVDTNAVPAIGLGKFYRLKEAADP